MKKFLSDWRIALVASLTLGLAPFSEPHIWGKLMWIKGGAVGMKPIDWFDTVLHGTPWVWLLITIGIAITSLLQKKKNG